jgi:hypothetical protein
MILQVMNSRRTAELQARIGKMVGCAKDSHAISMYAVMRAIAA